MDTKDGVSGHVIDQPDNGIALPLREMSTPCISAGTDFQGLTKPNQLHREATKYVSAKAQANPISLILEEGTLTEKEEDIYKARPHVTPRLKMQILLLTVCLLVQRSWLPAYDGRNQTLGRIN